MGPHETGSKRTQSVGQNDSLHIGKESSLTLYLKEGYYSKFIKNSRSYVKAMQITQLKIKVQH